MASIGTERPELNGHKVEKRNPVYPLDRESEDTGS
jgi:hypothetical protein